jgi:type III restriction enzyme
MFPLLRVLERKIAEFKRSQIEGVYQAALFDEGAKPEISFENGFKFKRGIFANGPRYTGDYEFQRHFLGPRDVPAFDGKPGGEEFRCAQALDSLESVRYWVRNVSRNKDAFWLPLKSGKFFPDFVAELTDGRVAVIEYKGDAYATNDDSRDKKAVGRVWQLASGGKGVFVFVEKEKDGENMRAQIENTIWT